MAISSGTLVPTRNQLLIPHSIARYGDGFVASNLSENGSYLGLPLVVILVVIAWRLRRDSLVRVLTWLAVGSLVLSLGPSLSIFNKNTHVPLPETVFAHLPLLDNTIPARYALYVSLFVAALLAIGIDRLWLGTALYRPPASMWRRFGRFGSGHACRPTRPGRGRGGHRSPYAPAEHPFLEPGGPLAGSPCPERANARARRLGHPQLPISDTAAA